MKNFKFSLAWQILIALILGIVVGKFCKSLCCS
ncbi:hypothetical protein, partial [Acinetobacter sp. 1566109]